MKNGYKIDGLYNIGGRTYVSVDENDIVDGYGRLMFTKVPKFIKDVLEERKIVYLGDEAKLLVELPYLLTGEENSDVIITPMGMISNDDNVIEPNEDGSYTIYFKTCDK